MAMSGLKIVARSLRVRAVSTGISAFSVAVAVAMLLTLLSLSRANDRAFEAGTGNAHLIVSREPSGLVSVLNTFFYAGAPVDYIDWATFERQLNSPGPRRMPPIALIGDTGWYIPVAIGDSYRGRPVLATSPEFFEKFTPRAGGEGWRFAQGGPVEGAFDLVLGSDTAQATGLTIGEIVHLTHGAPGPGGRLPEDAHVHTDFDFRVVGILERTGTAHDRALFAHIEGSWRMHASDLGDASARDLETPVAPAHQKVTAVLIKAGGRPGSTVTAAFAPLQSDLTRMTGLTIANPATEVRRLLRIVSNIDQVLIAMAGVILLSSGVSILLSLYNSMATRRRQIAVLRVLGASRRRIFSMVIAESAFIGVLGGVVGVVLAVVAGGLVAQALWMRVGVMLDPRLEFVPVLWTLVGTVVLAVLAGLAPAAVAYRTSVAGNLRPLV